MKAGAGKSEIVANGAAQAPEAEDAILQVRELLFGAEKRSTDTRFNDLDAKLEKLVAELRAETAQKFSEIESRVATLAKDVEDKRLTTVEDIGAAIAGLGATIRNLGAKA